MGLRATLPNHIPACRSEFSVVFLSQGFAFLVTISLIIGVIEPLPKTGTITNWGWGSNLTVPGLVYCD